MCHDSFIWFSNIVSNLVLLLMINSKSSHSKRRLTDSEMRDAVGRTKVALSVLQKGDCKSGKEMVEKALATWN